MKKSLVEANQQAIEEASSMLRLGLVVLAVLAMLVGGSWAQNQQSTPQVVFLEPKDGTVVSPDADRISIRFRLVSPDGTNLMRYEVFVDGAKGHLEPFPIEPPSPQVELMAEWQGIKSFPDGVHLITIKVVDAKGREGTGILSLYKGRDLGKPRAEILQPKSGDVVRGTVLLIIKVEDDRGLKSLSVHAIRREVAQRYALLLRTLQGRLAEVSFPWDTTLVDPQTKEPLYPDGVYILQAKVIDQDGNEGFSSEVLVTVRNAKIEPVIAQPPQFPGIRGGAVPPEPQNPTHPTAPVIVFPQRTIGGQPQPTPLTGVRQPAQLDIPEAALPMTKVAPVPERMMSPKTALPSTPALQTRQPMDVPPSEQQPMGAQITPSPERTLVPTPKGIDLHIPTRPSTQLPTSESASVGIAVGALPQRTTTPSTITTAMPQRERIPAPLLSESERLATIAALPQQALSTREPIPTVPSVARPSTQPMSVALPVSARLPQPERTLTPAPELPAPALPAPMLRSIEPSEGQPKPSYRRPTVFIRPSYSFRYTTIAGDTLDNLAERFGMSVKELAEANGLLENAPLRIGQRLLIPARPVSVLVDGKPAQAEVPAFVRDGTVVGSFRAVAELSGGIVTWDSQRKQAFATLSQLSLKVTIGVPKLGVNDEELPLQIAPFLLRNRTFLPLRPLGEALGKALQWSEGTLKMETPK